MTRIVPWHSLDPGDVVLGGDNKPWTFVERGDDWKVTLERDGRTWTGVPRNPSADLVHTAREAREAAVATTQVRLGGQVHAIKDDQGRWRTPVTFTHPGSLAGHIYILHGTTVPDADSLSALVAMHEQLHTPERKTTTNGYVEHVHDPEFHNG